MPAHVGVGLGGYLWFRAGVFVQFTLTPGHAHTRPIAAKITRVELEGGIYREPAQAPIRRVRLDAMLGAIPALAFDDLAAKTYGAIVASAGYSRRKLLDRMIAAQAVVPRATLVTFNEDDFSDIPGLSSLVWPSK